MSDISIAAPPAVRWLQPDATGGPGVVRRRRPTPAGAQARTGPNRTNPSSRRPPARWWQALYLLAPLGFVWLLDWTGAMSTGAAGTEAPSTGRAGVTAEIGRADGTPAGTAFGYSMGAGDVVWPAEPQPLERLLAALEADVLAWPGASWVVPPDPQGTIDVRVLHPGEPGRIVAMTLSERSGGWVVVGSPHQLQTGADDQGAVDLADVGFAPSTVAVELYRSDGTGVARSVLTDPADWEDGIRLGSAGRPLSLLVIGRDRGGEATTMVAVAVADRATPLRLPSATVER